VDSNGASFLALKEGDFFEIKDKKVKVIGFDSSYDGGEKPFVFCSPSTLKFLNGGSDWGQNYADFLLVKLKDSSAKKAVQAEMRKMSTSRQKFSVWTSRDLYWKSLSFWLLFNPDNLIWLFLIGLSLAVGTVIANNSLRSVMQASLREYAALRALGVSRRALCLVFLKQALYLGIAGVAFGLLLAWGFKLLAKWQGMSYYLPLWVVGIAAAAVLAAALAAGFISLFALYKTQPAELLR